MDRGTKSIRNGLNRSKDDNPALFQDIEAARVCHDEGTPTVPMTALT